LLFALPEIKIKPGVIRPAPSTTPFFSAENINQSLIAGVPFLGCQQGGL
jgi:hypothetical protein